MKCLPGNERAPKAMLFDKVVQFSGHGSIENPAP